MREFVDVSVLANWVRMARGDVDGAILLADDDEEARFYETCVHDTALVVPANGAAVPVLDTLLASGLEGVGAFVRDIQGQQCTDENLLCPTVGDVASLLLASTGCKRVIQEVFGAPWLKACEKEIGPVVPRAVWLACMLQHLRQVCVSAGVQPLERSDIAGLIRWDLFELDWDRVRSLLSGLGSQNAALEEVGRIGYGTGNLNEDLRGCDGMDAVRVLEVATQSFRPRGIGSKTVLNDGALIGTMRVAFELGEIEEDGLFWQMKQWEHRNKRYHLLKEWRTRDPLGVLLDQRYWERDLDYAVRMLGTDRSLAAFKMDLDNFKGVNNTLGHNAGDEAIRLYCSIVKRLLGQAGDAYRRGGDEVVALVPGLDTASARTLGERIRARIEKDLREWSSQRGLKSCPTASIGLVVTDGNRSAAEVARLMDEAQRRAKAEGKNRVSCLP